MASADYQKLKSRLNSQPKIMLEQLVLSQMQQSIGASICDQVRSARGLLVGVGPARSRRLVYKVENSLLNYLKGKPTKIFKKSSEISLLYNGFYKSTCQGESSDSHTKQNLMTNRLRRTQDQEKMLRTDGILVKNFISHLRSPQKDRQSSDLLQAGLCSQAYSPRQHLRKQSQNNFNLIMHF